MTGDKQEKKRPLPETETDTDTGTTQPTQSVSKKSKHTAAGASNEGNTQSDRGGDMKVPSPLEHWKTDLPKTMTEPKPRLDHLTDLAGQLVGFLVTCPFKREISATLELYKLLDEELKEHNLWDDVKDDMKRWNPIKSGCRGAFFLQMKYHTDRVLDVARSFIKKVESGEVKLEFVKRALPVQATCEGNIDSVYDTCKTLVEERLAKHKDTTSTFCVTLKRRGGDAAGVDRDEAIKKVATLFRGSGCKVNLKEPDVVVAIETLQGISKACAMCTIIEGDMVSVKSRGIKIKGFND
eukprot:GFYU01005755.1.p1 GENE.GFYU01005755.1~~GFYU01005755.1.p1  ORF type:complete len:295 (-),score=79.59 GFYU01005755.1:277-1161(-)